LPSIERKLLFFWPFSLPFVYKLPQRIAMIFCKKCGRYNQDGQATCRICGADLKSAGHATFSGGNVKTTPASPKPPEQPAPSSVRTTTASIIPRTAPAPAAPAPPARDVESIFKRDKFLLRQKTIAISEKYYVQDDSGTPLMFVERPALVTQRVIMLAATAVVFFGGTSAISFFSDAQLQQIGPGLHALARFLEFLVVLGITTYVFVLLVPKRHVEFFTDDTKTQKLLEVKQLKVEFPFANFTIVDPTGNIIGRLRKNVLFDYIRRRWYVMSGSGLALCTIKEDSMVLSLFRRMGLPLFSFMPTNFIFIRDRRVQS
jgi:uncharacterized protein YxjI